MHHPRRLSLVFALLAFTRFPAGGQNFTVDSTIGGPGPGSLTTAFSQAAIGANTSYAIGFSFGSSPTTIFLNQSLSTITKNIGVTLDLTQPAPTGLLTIDGNTRTIFNFAGGGNFIVSNIYLRDGTNFISSGALTASSFQFDNLNLSNSLLNATGNVTGGNLILSSSTLNISQTVTMALTGAISGDALNVVGPGTLDLTGAASNAVTGGAAIDSTTVSISRDAQLGAPSGGVTLQDGAVLQTVAAVTSSRSFTLGTGGGAINTNANVTELDGKVTGAGGLTVKGGGALVLTNTSNSYGGGTLVDGATLSVSADGQLGNSAGGITLQNGGVLKTTTSVNSSRSITLGSGGGTIDTSGQTSTFSDPCQITDNGGNVPLTVKGGGTLVFLNTSNSYGGGAIIDGATVTINSDAQLGASAGAVELLDGGTLRTSTGINTSCTISLSTNGGAVDVSANQTTTLNGAFSGSGQFTKSGLGNLVLSGSAGLPAGNIVVATGTLTLIETAPTAYAGSISGPGSLTQSGNTLTLSGVNTYTGGTTVTSGCILNVSSDSNLGDVSGILTLNGGTLHNTADLISGRSVVLTGNGGIFDQGEGYLTFTQPISGTGALTKQDDNYLTLTGAQTYTGSTTVEAGILKLAAGTLASPSVDVYSGATFLLSGNSKYAGTITDVGGAFASDGGVNIFTGTAMQGGGTNVNSGTLQIGDGVTDGSLSGNVNISAGATLAFDRVGASTLQYTGTISGAGALQKDGVGTLELDGTNTMGSIVLDAGRLGIGSDTALGSGNITINGGEIRAVGAQHNVSNTVTVNGSFTLGRETNFTNDVTLGADVTITSANPDTDAPSSSTISGSISGNHSLTFTEGANPIGEIILSGANTYSGGTILQAGKLAISNNNGLGAGVVSIQGGVLEAESGVTIPNTIFLAGGTYSHIVTGNLTNALNATSSVGGRATSAQILAGSASTSSTLLSTFSATSTALNDQVRVSDDYSFTGTGSAPFVLQLSVATGLQNGGYLGWETSGDIWTNAVTGNTGNNAAPLMEGFAGSFTSFENLCGTKINTYIGAWGFDESSNTVWAVLDDNGNFAAVPEPATASLLIFGTLLGVTRRPGRARRGSP